MNIQMCDLLGQYKKNQQEIDDAISHVIQSSAFINGPQVKKFKENFEEYTGSKHVIPCANGTDALQIALMALNLQPGDEVIVPSFTYVAAAEVIGLLKLVPVMVDVDERSYNVTLSNIEKGLTPRSRAIIPVHLFGQSCPMEEIMGFAQKNNLFVIEDNAQSTGTEYIFSNRLRKQTGTIGHIGCTSFFPTKNLGCYGDGGAIMTNDDELAERLRMITVHGQKMKYHHEILGCNSRLDTIQAAILTVKLKYLDQALQARRSAGLFYSEKLNGIDEVVIPSEMDYSTHTYNQYTIKVKNGKRDALRTYLSQADIPTMVYYPLPLSEQNAFKNIARAAESLYVSKKLSETVLSLPIHPELRTTEQEYIVSAIKKFFS